MARVFLGSPFGHRRSTIAELRSSLYDRLREMHHDPWLWELSVRRLVALGYRPRGGEFRSDDIIRSAIQASDAFVAFYTEGVGRTLYVGAMREDGEEQNLLYATEFEIAVAMNARKPILLCCLEPHAYKVHVLAEALVLWGYPNFSVWRFEPQSERIQLLDAITERICGFLADELAAPKVDSGGPLSFAACTPLSIDEVAGATLDLGPDLRNYAASETRIDAAISAVRAWLGADGPRDRPEVIAAVGKFLTHAANVRVNRGQYDQAIWAAECAVRLYALLGDIPSMLGQVQAYSGILNMAGRTRAAWHQNEYGYARAKQRRNEYRDLMLGFLDSRASILVQVRRFDRAAACLQEAVVSAGSDPGPYVVSKLERVRALGARRARAWGSLDASLRALVEVALPYAQATGRSVEYVSMEAGRVALLAHEFGMARGFLDTAEKIAHEKGTHTLRIVSGLREAV